MCCLYNLGLFTLHEPLLLSPLAEQIPGSLFFPSFEAMAENLRRLVVPGDSVLTGGAGDVYKIGEALVKLD